MNIKSLLGAATIAIAMATPGQTAPIDLDFSFANLSGTFFGLDNSDGISSASSVVFNGGFDSYAFGTTGSTANQFTFLAGSLIDMAFSDTDPHLGSGAIGLLTNFDCLFNNCTTSEQTFGAGAFLDVPGSAPAFAQRSISNVPLPGGGLLVISGMVGLVGLRRVSQRFRAKRPRRAGALRRAGS